MSRRRAALTALGITAGLTAAVLLLSFGDDPYRVEVRLASGAGLREGAQVKVGGVPVGEVKSLGIGARDEVVAELELDEIAIGKGASAEVVSSNLLGSKYLRLRPGDRAAPQPSGSVIPPSRVSYPVDLDQVLDVLDPDTRTRVQMLINEAGFALTGRRADFNQALALLPRDLAAGRRLLDEVAADNRALGQTVEASRGFVGRIAAERTSLGRLIESGGETMRALNERRAQLRRTLSEAPGALRTLRRFLADLRSTTIPLGPAARSISAAAPHLQTTLAELKPFEHAAEPALEKAIDVAPVLSRLGRRATPVIRRANPTLKALAELSGNSGPAFTTLEASVDDVLALIEGWARAIQTRDSISHVFHGRAVFGEQMRSSLAMLEGPHATARTPRASRRGAVTPSEVSPPRPSASQSPGDAPNAPAPRPAIPGQAVPALPQAGNSAEGLLDYLLGP